MDALMRETLAFGSATSASGRAPIASSSSGRAPATSATQFPKCGGCGGWGKGLVKDNGFCDHCTSTGNFGSFAPKGGSKRPRTDDGAQDDDRGRSGRGAGAGAAHDDVEEEDEADVVPSAEEIRKMLEEADKADLPALDANGVKRMLLKVERAISKNQNARAKYHDQPARFLDTEIELDTELKALRSLAAAPDQYNVLVRSDSLKSFMSLLSHENSDIAIDVVQLFVELLGADAIGEDDEELDGDADGDDDADGAVPKQSLSPYKQAQMLVDALVESGALELLIANAERLDGAGTDGSADDSAGVLATLQLLVAMIDLRPALVSRGLLEITTAASTRTPRILSFLLKKLRNSKGYDDTKGLAAELLSLILAGDGKGENARLMGSATFARAGKDKRTYTIDGIEYLLEIFNMYRKAIGHNAALPPAIVAGIQAAVAKLPRNASASQRSAVEGQVLFNAGIQRLSRDEEDVIENVFDCLATCLLVPENQSRFRSSEGFELMLRIMHENGFCRFGALRSLSYAVANSARNCEAFIAAGGLKQLFPAFLGRGLSQTRKQHGAESAEQEEEYSVSIVSYCLQLLPNPQPGQAPETGRGLEKLRLLQKFREATGESAGGGGSREKIDRLVELHVQYGRKVSKLEAALDEEDADAGSEDEDDENSAELKAESRYLARLRGGLYTLQRIDLVLARLLTASNDAELSFAVRSKLYEQGSSVTRLISTLEEYAERLGARSSASSSTVGGDAGDGGAGGSSESGGQVDAAAAAEKQDVQRLIAVLAASAGLLETEEGENM